MRNIGKAAVILGLSLALFLGCGSSKEEAPSSVTDPKQLMEAKCTACHFSDRIFKEPRYVDEWKAIVDRMRSKNVSWITPEEASRIFNYLVENNSKKE